MIYHQKEGNRTKPKKSLKTNAPSSVPNIEDEKQIAPNGKKAPSLEDVASKVVAIVGNCGANLGSKELAANIGGFSTPYPAIVEKLRSSRIVVTIVRSKEQNNFLPQKGDKCISLLFDSDLERFKSSSSFVVETTSETSPEYLQEVEALKRGGDTRGFSFACGVESFSCVEYDQRQLELERTWEKIEKQRQPRDEMETKPKKQRRLPYASFLCDLDNHNGRGKDEEFER